MTQLRIILSFLFIAFLYGCASTSPKIHTETQACINYRSMMTAPMPPDAMQRLKQACEVSKVDSLSQ